MSQTDMNVANGSGATVRADINAHLQAIVENSSGATAPTTTFANQWWADTNTNILKRRNNANTAWISVMSLTTGLIIGTDVLAPDGDGSSLTGIAKDPSGQCYLGINGANLELTPKNGNKLLDGAGNVLTVPSSLTLAPTSATPSTLYNIYAWASSGSTLDNMEYSATAVTTTNGVAHKTGDTGRVHVGWAYAITGPAWADSASQRLVVSRFNPIAKHLEGASQSTAKTNTSDAETATAARVEFIVGDGRAMILSVTGYAANQRAGTMTSFARLSVDGTSFSQYASGTTTGVNYSFPIGQSKEFGPSDGYHFGTLHSYSSDADGATFNFQMGGVIYG